MWYTYIVLYGYKEANLWLYEHYNFKNKEMEISLICTKSSFDNRGYFFFDWSYDYEEDFSFICPCKMVLPLGTPILDWRNSKQVRERGFVKVSAKRDASFESEILEWHKDR